MMAKDTNLPDIKDYTIAAVDDYGFPFLSLVELVFYFGWLKSIALIFDPFADAGYAFDLVAAEEGIRSRECVVCKACTALRVDCVPGIHTVFEAYRRPEECMPELETDANNVFGYEPNTKPEWGKMQLDEMKINNTKHDSVPQMQSNSQKPTAKDVVGHTL